MKLWLRVFVGTLLLCPVLAQAAHAEDPSKLPKPTSYVSDFAGVIDAGSKAQMEQLCHEVYEQAHATIEVVTVKSLNGDSIEDFTTQLEDNWKVGDKAQDRGVILIISIGDRKRRIEVGRGLEGILNDAKVGDIGRAMSPQLSAGQYGPGLLYGTVQVANVIAADAHVTLQQPASAPVQQPVQQAAHSSRFSWVGIVIFLIFIFLAFRRGGRGGWLWFLLGNMMGGGGGRGGWGGGGDSGGGDGGGSDFGGGFGGGSDGGGASGSF